MESEMVDDAILLMLGQMQGEMKGIGREIGEIKSILKCKTEDCVECRKELDSTNTVLTKKIVDIETAHTGEKAVGTWLDSSATKISMLIGAACGIIGIVYLLLGKS